MAIISPTISIYYNDIMIYRLVVGQDPKAKLS